MIYWHTINTQNYQQLNNYYCTANCYYYFFSYFYHIIFIM